MSSQTGFWFPSMKISEITRTLEEWGLRISDEQIQKPTAEAVMQIHLLFLQLLTGITPEMLEMPASKASTVIEDHTDLYMNGLNMSLVLYHAQRIAQAARSHDFSIRDLVYPEPERTRNILSAIINFIKFAEERDGFIKKLREQSESAQLEREQTVRRVNELKGKIAEIKAQRQAEEPRCAALREEAALISKAISVLKNNHDALTKEINKYKRDKATLTQQKESILQEVSLVSASVNSTRSRIVQSPDRIKKQIGEMGRMAQEERLVIAGNEAKTRELKIKLDALNILEQDMKKLIDNLRVIQSEQMQIENVSERIAEFRSELDRKVIYREQLLGRVERAKRQLTNAEEKLTRAQQLGEDRRRRSEDEITRLRKEYEEMSEERRENDKQVEDMKEAVAELERKMLEHLKKNEAELNELLAEYWAVRNDTEVYMETLANKFGIVVS